VCAKKTKYTCMFMRRQECVIIAQHKVANKSFEHVEISNV